MPPSLSKLNISTLAPNGTNNDPSRTVDVADDTLKVFLSQLSADSKVYVDKMLRMTHGTTLLQSIFHLSRMFLSTKIQSNQLRTVLVNMAKDVDFGPGNIGADRVKTFVGELYMFWQSRQ